MDNCDPKDLPSDPEFHSERGTHGQLRFFCSLTLRGPLSALPIHSENRTEHSLWYVSLKKDAVDL